jgi:hypothetical protein
MAAASTCFFSVPSEPTICSIVKVNKIGMSTIHSSQFQAWRDGRTVKLVTSRKFDSLGELRLTHLFLLKYEFKLEKSRLISQCAMIHLGSVMDEVVLLV